MRNFVIGLVGATALLASTSAVAAIVLDQNALVGPRPSGANITLVALAGNIIASGPNGGTQIVDQRFVQTITAGKSGQLASVNLQTFNVGPANGIFRLSLIDGDYGIGARTVLGTQNYALASIASGISLVAFDTTAFGFDVNPGKSFSILGQVFGPLPSSFIFGLEGYGSFPVSGQPLVAQGLTRYAGGTRYQFIGTSAPIDTRRDIGFQTYVASVPEPGNWAMMILGFGIAGGAMRSSKRRTMVTFG